MRAGFLSSQDLDYFFLNISHVQIPAELKNKKLAKLF